MSADARLSTGLPGHPKTKKLIRRLGPGAGWSLVCLILWTRANRPDGDLSGMSTEDVELAAEWTGENDSLVREMLDIRFLDEDAEGNLRLHDWADHQPWAAGSDLRSLKARWNAVKRHHGIREADRQVPEYARIRAESPESDASSTKSDASSNAISVLAAQGCDATSRKTDAPSPSPSPSPSPKAEEQSSLRSDSSAPLALTPAPADLKTKQKQRIQQIAGEAREAYNLILGKPNGLLPSCAVLNGPRVKAVEKCLPTARAICLRLYGNERVTPKFWQDYFDEAAADDFHAGRKQGGPGHEGWKPDFEFLLRETVMAKLFDRAMSADPAEAAA